jgi:hypothetical protein
LAAPDFIFLRTTRSSLHEFLRHFDWTRLQAELPDAYAWLTRGRDVLLIRVEQPGGLKAAGRLAANPLLVALDGAGHVRCQLFLAASPSGTVEYVEEGGREWPANGLLLRGGGAPGGPTTSDAGIPIPAAQAEP